MPSSAPSPLRLIGPRSRRSSGPRLTVAIVVGASAVVAVAVAGAGLLAPPASIGPAWERGLRYLGLVIVLVGIAGLAWDRPAGRPTRGPDPTLASIFAAALLMSALALASLLAPRSPFGAGDSPRTATARAGMGPEGVVEGQPPPPPPPGGTADLTEGSGPETGGLAPPPPDDPARRSAVDPPPGFDWGPLSDVGDVLLAALLVGLLIAGRWAVKRRPDDAVAAAPDDGDEVVDRAAVIGAELESLLASGLPSSEQITAAYQRLLAVLATFGAGRQPHEAPLEHLGRALAPLGVGPAPMRRLAELYVLAQFGDRPVDEAHRTAAISALRSSLAALGARAGGGSPGGLRGGEGP